mmetsp:Transcript_1525/g.1030  ORF Transcript_1525/g.1030 Transcript_1525/m.1030 type:complete len:170 (+) Transcript_1525:108-617(+)
MMDPAYYDDFYYMNMTEFNMGAAHGPYMQTTRMDYYYGYIEFGFISEFMFLPANAKAHISIPASVIEAQEMMTDLSLYKGDYTGGKRQKSGNSSSGMELNFFFYDWTMSFDVSGSNYTINKTTGDYVYTFNLGNQNACVLSHGTRYFYLGQLYAPADTGMLSFNVKFTD